MGFAKKKFRIDAELAYYYGAAACTLGPKQRLGLYANIPKVKAMKRLETGTLAGLSWKQVEALYLFATDNPELAKQMRIEFLEREVERETNNAFHTMR